MKLKTMLEAVNNFGMVTNWINANYKEMKVAEMLDDEIMNWIEPDWEDDGIDNEFDWYQEYSNGEAEDAVRDNIISSAERALKIKFSTTEEIKLNDWLKNKYDFLQG